MEIRDVHVQQFGGSTPDGISADIALDSGVVLEVYRGWDSPQWYICNITVEGAEVGIYDLDGNLPIPSSTKISAALEKKVDAIRDQYSPA